MQGEGIDNIMTLEDILRHDNEFKYGLLGRLRSDCEYYLGYGHRCERCLWANSVSDQIHLMKAIWKSFDKSKKPVWLTYKQILEYERRMQSR